MIRTKTNPKLSAFCHALLSPATVIALTALTVMTPLTARAAITVQEDFNYGSTAISLVGQNGGVGFSTAWNGGNYIPTSLVFSGVSSVGGAYKTDAGGGQRVFTTAFSMTGPIYGSFLFNSTQTAATVQQLGIGNSGASNNQNSALRFSASSDGASPGRQATVVVQGGTEGSLTSGGYSSSVTYMYLFHYQNNTATAWMLNENQYANFASGGFSESALNSASFGSGSTNVTGRSSSSGTVTQALTQMNMYAFQSNGTTFDRIRLSDISLSAVAADAPEPGSLSLLGLGIVSGAGAMGTIRRRRCRMEKAERTAGV